jgi:hypothetical protein
MKSAALLGLLFALGAQAQGFQDEPTCYSWSGGHKSAGSFTKCTPEIKATSKPTPPAPVAVAAPVTAPPLFSSSPIMMPVCVNPVAQDKPKPKQKGKPKPKPGPKKICN